MKINILILELLIFENARESVQAEVSDLQSSKRTPTKHSVDMHSGCPYGNSPLLSSLS
jgi:hypothetical protein